MANNLEKLNSIAEKATKEYLDSRSLLLLEAAVGCLLDTRTPQETAKVLREMANHLEEFG